MAFVEKRDTVIVANQGQVKLITESSRKTIDWTSNLGAAGGDLLLRLIQHRSEGTGAPDDHPYERL